MTEEGWCLTEDAKAPLPVKPPRGEDFTEVVKAQPTLDEETMDVPFGGAMSNVGVTSNAPGEIIWGVKAPPRP